MTQLLAAPAPALRRHTWTTAEFNRLVAEGFLREGSRTHLWDGEIIDSMPENPPHINASERLRSILDRRLPEADWTVNAGRPISLAERYQPQPDITVLRGPRSAFRARMAGPADVALLVEVSDSTYADDSGSYLRKYATEGVAQYWIVNIHARRVEVYTGPHAEDGGSFDTRRDFALGEQVPLELVAGDAVRAFDPIGVDDILRDSL